MPIPVAVLDQAARPLRERVLDVLSKDPSQAYSAVEIYGRLQGLTETALAVLAILTLAAKTSAGLSPVEETLRALEADGLVRSAVHNNVTYYAIRQP
jgi:Fe2+ or Zn2+ uptake regulation protein